MGKWSPPRKPRTPPPPDTVYTPFCIRSLGLAMPCTVDDIKVAYKKLAKECHPDTANGSDEAFKRLRAAYERAIDWIERRGVFEVDM